MAIGDFLKKSVSKGLKSLGTAKEVVKQVSAESAQKRKEEALEKIRLEKEEKLEQERAEKAARAEARAKLLTPSCEKGDCLWLDHKFYCTCPENAECQRKNVVMKKDMGDALYDKRFWPYMKRLELIRKAVKEDAPHPDNYGDLIEEFVNEFLPIYSDYLSMKAAIERSVFHNGFTRDNTFLYLMLDLKDIDLREDFEASVRKEYTSAYTYETNSILDSLRRRYVPGCTLHLNYDFYRNPSLYKRSLEDFEFTVKTFETVLDEEKLSEFFFDTSFISEDQLYDENGNIKEAGRGGPEAGEYGDTIFNTIESWSGENGENDRQKSE